MITLYTFVFKNKHILKHNPFNPLFTPVEHIRHSIFLVPKQTWFFFISQPIIDLFVDLYEGYIYCNKFLLKTYTYLKWSVPYKFC